MRACAHLYLKQDTWRWKFRRFVLFFYHKKYVRAERSWVYVKIEPCPIRNPRPFPTPLFRVFRTLKYTLVNFDMSFIQPLRTEFVIIPEIIMCFRAQPDKTFTLPFDFKTSRCTFVMTHTLQATRMGDRSFLTG